MIWLHQIPLLSKPFGICGDYNDNNNKNFKIEFYKKEIAVLKDVDKLKFTIDKDLDHILN